MAYPVATVARYILAKTGKIGMQRLEKLLYYSQAWSLVWKGRSLISEDFQAWGYGPVCPALRFYCADKLSVSVEDIPAMQNGKGEITLDDDDQKIIDAVIGEYGKKENHQLTAMIWSDPPWNRCKSGKDLVRMGLPVISKRTIARHYRSL